MISPIAQCVLVSVLSWALWKLYKHAVVKVLIRNLPGPPSSSWFTGNLGQVFGPANIQFHHEVVGKYGGAVKIHGILGDENVYFSDPRALHHIVVKDQHIFEVPSLTIAVDKLVLGDGLLTTIGDHHRKQRKILNPVFSINHMRDLTPVFYEIMTQLCDVLTRKIREDGTKEIDMLDWMSRTALEYIGQGGLGYSFGPLEESLRNPYSDAVRKLVPTLTLLLIEMQLLPLLIRIGPPSFRRFILELLPSEAIQRMKNITDIMDRTSKEILQAKKAALAQGDDAILKQIGQGKDIMSVLLRANAAASEKDRLPEHEVVAQMTTLIFAAHDTTSAALARILHLLSLHPDAQERLRLEVISARAVHGGENLGYDQLMSLPYLDAVCRETLRLHAPVTSIFRTARKATVVPLLRPVQGTDGNLIHEVPVAAGQNVLVGIAAANRDVATWGADAGEWRPERWLGRTPESVSAAHLPGVYSGMMTFMGGSRACIGFKFSQLEMKIVLFMLLEKFSFSLPQDEIVWNMHTIQTPTVKGREKEAPHLPLTVSLL